MHALWIFFFRDKIEQFKNVWGSCGCTGADCGCVWAPAACGTFFISHGRQDTPFEGRIADPDPVDLQMFVLKDRDRDPNLLILDPIHMGVDPLLCHPKQEISIKNLLKIAEIHYNHTH